MNEPMKASGGVSRSELLRAFDALLQPERFKDFGPNGLQVEGRGRVQHIVSGVTASLALIEAAVACKADAIFVHHGLFWRGQDGRVTGWMKQRLALLLKHDINLFAYHLPLDAHPLLGNNAQLGLRLGLQAFEGLAAMMAQNASEINKTQPDESKEVATAVQNKVVDQPVEVEGRLKDRIERMMKGRNRSERSRIKKQVKAMRMEMVATV